MVSSGRCLPNLILLVKKMYLFIVIGGQLLYNIVLVFAIYHYESAIVLVFAIHHYESAIGKHVSLPS